MRVAGIEPAWSLIKSQVHKAALPHSHGGRRVNRTLPARLSGDSMFIRHRCTSVLASLVPRPEIESDLPPYESGVRPAIEAFQRSWQETRGSNSAKQVLETRPYPVRLPQIQNPRLSAGLGGEQMTKPQTPRITPHPIRFMRILVTTFLRLVCMGTMYSGSETVARRKWSTRQDSNLHTAFASAFVAQCLSS